MPIDDILRMKILPVEVLKNIKNIEYDEKPDQNGDIKVKVNFNAGESFNYSFKKPYFDELLEKWKQASSK